MHRTIRYALFRGFALLILFLLTANLACGPFGSVPEVSIPEGARATAGAMVDQAGNVAKTAVAVATSEGGAALATVRAMDTPDASALNDKLAAGNTDEAGNYSVTIEEGDVNKILSLQQLLAGPASDYLIRDIRVAFNQGSITLTGQIVQPLTTSIRLAIQPQIVDGMIHFTVAEASSGDSRVPTAVLDGAQQSLSDVLNTALHTIPAGISITGVLVADGTLTISGHKG